LDSDIERPVLSRADNNYGSTAASVISRSWLRIMPFCVK